ncbi:MAG: DNA polymerase-3 subunit beta [Verrucomicrobiales bacterium]|jgi:DNA polymerase-3 subunit beta
MKFKITKEKFIEGLSQVQQVVGARTTLPILSNVLLEAKDGMIRMTTTDLDVGIRGSVEAEIETEGGSTLPARKLASIVRELPTSEILVEVDSDNAASITAGPSFFKIKGLGQDEFPPLPDFEDAMDFKLDQKLLRDSLKKTSYAISTDETRYVLNGIYCSFKEGTITLVATDGRRLAMVDHELEFPESQETEIIIPTKAVNELQRLLADSGDVRIRITDSQIAFELNGYLLTSKLIEGSYPNFRQVIPAEAKQRVTFDRETLREIVHRVSLLTSDKSSSIKIKFADDNIEVMANSPDVGEARESLPVQYSGPEMTIAFNPDFLMAPLRNLDTDEIHLDLIDEMSPGVLKINEPFLYVLMPMRVTG